MLTMYSTGKNGSQEMQHNNTELEQGKQARLIRTGQIVNIKQLSQHGMAIVTFRTGGEHFILNKYLEPVGAAA